MTDLYKEIVLPDEVSARYPITATGDACVGDEVVFFRAVFEGSYRNATFMGYELVEGTITRDSYGADKQQHTFTITLPDGGTTRIKGRNLYRNGLYRKRRDVVERDAALEEKHERGSAARAEREARRGW